jgi:hypothetical protein
MSKCLKEFARQCQYDFDRAMPTFTFDRLSRYEHLLWRQARQIVFTLESLRRRKRLPSRSTFPFSFRRREPGTLPEEFG